MKDYKLDMLKNIMQTHLNTDKELYELLETDVFKAKFEGRIEALEMVIRTLDRVNEFNLYGEK